MLDSFKIPIVFAHRGASADAPENTLASFSLAVTLGSSAIELDVQLSADDSVVVFHDPSVEKTTNGKGKIKDLTLDQIKSLDAGHTFGNAYPAEKIPTLEEVFSALSPEIFLNIELKNLTTPTDNLSEEVAKLIQNHHAEHRVLVSSFSPEPLKKFQNLLPSVPLGRLIYRPVMVDFHRIFSSSLSFYQTVHISIKAFNKRRIDSLHKLGKQVFIYTLNHPRDILAALNCGADGFFTDDPALANRILAENGYNLS